MSYTEGPWHVYHYGVHNTKEDIAVVNSGNKAAEANSRLIAASPQMFEALKNIYNYVGENPNEQAEVLLDEIYNMASSAIAKVGLCD
jgi:hypothetical protein